MLKMMFNVDGKTMPFSFAVLMKCLLICMCMFYGSEIYPFSETA